MRAIDLFDPSGVAAAPRADPPDGAGRPDLDLIRDSLTQPETFTSIFDRHADAIHHFLSRRVGDLADDLVSETFLIAFRKRADYRPERLEVRPWLYGIAANLVRRHHRAEASRYRLIAKAATAVDGPADGDYAEADARADARAVGPQLAAALAALKTADREVLLLLAWGDLTPTQIAAALDLRPGTVRSRLHRARTQVRAYLEPAPQGSVTPLLSLPEHP